MFHCLMIPDWPDHIIERIWLGILFDWQRLVVNTCAPFASAFGVLEGLQVWSDKWSEALGKRHAIFQERASREYLAWRETQSPPDDTPASTSSPVPRPGAISGGDGQRHE
jgi:hypothetical protein